MSKWIFERTCGPAAEQAGLRRNSLGASYVVLRNAAARADDVWYSTHSTWITGNSDLARSRSALSRRSSTRHW
jgi:hypothetical protein